VNASRTIAVLALFAATGACASPEAERARGEGRGADSGNRTAVVQMHGGSVMYYQTPCVITRQECEVQQPRTGLARRARD
jgi:hypothetical protein